MPSYRELRDEFGWKSTGTVRDHLQALARKGHIELSGPGHRRIRLLADRLAVTGVPVIGRVTAGGPLVVEEEIEQHIPVPADWLGSGVCFAVRVEGDRMLGAGIHAGDCIIVQRQNVAADGELVLATHHGKTMVKRYERRGTQVTLRSEGERHPMLPVKPESTVVQGIIVGLMRAYHDRGPIHRSPHRGADASRRGRSRHAEGE